MSNRLPDSARESTDFYRIKVEAMNPETLARGLRFLTRNGYQIKRIKPFDLFPFTKHVETVVLMSRKDT